MIAQLNDFSSRTPQFAAAIEKESPVGTVEIFIIFVFTYTCDIVDLLGYEAVALAGNREWYFKWDGATP